MRHTEHAQSYYTLQVHVYLLHLLYLAGPFLKP